MTRDGAVELIQRDLDEDLSSEEKHRLHLMLQNDSELQLIYDRLMRVSDELSQLPAVTPKFSLVDAILPQLETAAYESSPAVVSRAPELPRLAPKKQEPAERRKPHRLPLWVAKVGSGVAAACLLFGLLFMVAGMMEKKEPEATPAADPSAVNPAKQQPTVPTVVPPDKVDHTVTKENSTKNQPNTNSPQINQKNGNKATANTPNPAATPPKGDQKLVRPPVQSTAEKDKAREYKDEKRDPEDRKFPVLTHPIKGNETEREVSKQKKKKDGNDNDREDGDDNPGDGKEKKKDGKDRGSNDDNQGHGNGRGTDHNH